jgi:amphi-Trp domain-containing protein
MKFQEGFIGSKSEVAAYVKKMIPDLFGGRLSLEGKALDLPTDCNLDCKLKYSEEETGSSFTFKISWEKGDAYTTENE